MKLSDDDLIMMKLKNHKAFDLIQRDVILPSPRYPASNFLGFCKLLGKSAENFDVGNINFHFDFPIAGLHRLNATGKYLIATEVAWYVIGRVDRAGERAILDDGIELSDINVDDQIEIWSEYDL